MNNWKEIVIEKYYDSPEVLGRAIARELGIPKSTLHDFKKAIQDGLVVRDKYLTKPRILLLDIETAPILADVWGLWNNNISLDQIRRDWYMLSWSAKLLGSDIVTHDALPRYPAHFKYTPYNDKKIVESLHALLSSVDIVIGHNLDKFDLKKSTAKFLKYGLKPLPYIRTIDTLKIAKREFKLTSNKLDYLAQYLGLGRKVQHEGHSLWTKCQEGCSKSWEKMIEYNIHDVELLEKVYLKIRAWDSKHPNVAVYYSDFKERCPCCGSDDLQSHPEQVVTNLSSFDQVTCNICGKVSRRGTNTLTKDKRESILRNC